MFSKLAHSAVFLGFASASAGMPRKSPIFRRVPTVSERICSHAMVNRHHERVCPSRAPLLCTLKGGKLNTSYVRALLPRLAKAGIEKRVHAHGLRHSHAADLVREGVPVNLIQRQLGDASLAAVSQTRPGDEKARRQHRPRLPLTTRTWTLAPT
jgi:integrase